MLGFDAVVNRSRAAAHAAVAIAVAVGALACRAGEAPRPAPEGSASGAPDAPCTVARVADGDTLTCADGRRIRLLLIDTPEMSQVPFGTAAREALLALAPEGTLLQVENDVEVMDQYGRVLAYLFLEDGRLVNEELLRLGVAVVTVYPPNVRRVDRLRAVVAEAQAARVGLWAVDAFACLPADRRAERC